MKAETAEERHVWDLLTRDFYWDVPADHPVKVQRPAGKPSGPVRLQIFEVAITAVLAHVRPSFLWTVTPNRADNGLDFKGEQRFLDDVNLGIAAAITVGGQCKKRTHVGDVVSEVAGSLIRMADAWNPTFFVVALSARLTRKRVTDARSKLERQCLRHCHILDRTQIEGLLADHLDAVVDLLEAGLDSHEAGEVLAYFQRLHAGAGGAPSVDVTAPERVYAGVPFRVDVTVRSTLVSNRRARLWWRAAEASETRHTAVELIGPVAADQAHGVALASDGLSDDPLLARISIELVTYAVGRVDLGAVDVGLDADGAPGPVQRTPVGSAAVIEIVRPRFFEPPFQVVLGGLRSAYGRAAAGDVVSVGVVGAGGSGKSRVCEEFALEQRRRGCEVVTAKQAKSHDDPRRIVADLLLSLAAGEEVVDPAARIIRAVSRYDGALARAAEPTVHALIGTAAEGPRTDTHQTALSAAVLLIVARARRQPLIVHLQDLHWCSADVLLLLERLVWQVSQVVGSPHSKPGVRGSGVLFLFEGRVRERNNLDASSWSSEPFETFVERRDCDVVACRPFDADASLAFVHVLFEQGHIQRRVVADDLLGLQQQLIRQIDRTAGGNPFHTLEQIRLLKQRRVLGQNPETGLLYLIQPESVEPLLPETVFESIELRWCYLRDRSPDLALLVWGCALLEDRIPVPLFRSLWAELAPDVSMRDVDATDMLWTGEGREPDVVFRHENYFEALRRFTVDEGDRRRVVAVYCRWFEGRRRLTAADRFRWARALLELPHADVRRARTLLTTALRAARRQGDVPLARQISTFHLDLMWRTDDVEPLPASRFTRLCDQEADLAHELLWSDRDQAARRLSALVRRIDARMTAAARRTSRHAFEDLARRKLAAELVTAELLFNDERPRLAAEIAGRAVTSIRSQRPRATAAAAEWERLELRALHARICALALSGEIDAALETAEGAAAIARRSASPLSRDVISLYANILLVKDPVAAEALLRECLDATTVDPTSAPEVDEVHLSMALVLQAYRCGPLESQRKQQLLDDARSRLDHVFEICDRLGLHSNAAAAALMRGIVSVIAGDGVEVTMFAEAVAAAARGRQMETLWRSHINLATAVYRHEGRATPRVRDHALAALTIMQRSLDDFPLPDASPRFRLLSVPMANAVRFLVEAGDDMGLRALERYPALRAELDRRPGPGGHDYYEWLRIGDAVYVLY